MGPTGSAERSARFTLSRVRHSSADCLLAGASDAHTAHSPPSISRRGTHYVLAVPNRAASLVSSEEPLPSCALMDL